ATKESEYRAIGATSCCSSWGDCCAGGVGGCSLDWPVGPKDSACAVNRTRKQQTSTFKIRFDKFIFVFILQYNLRPSRSRTSLKFWTLVKRAEELHCPRSVPGSMSLRRAKSSNASRSVSVSFTRC